MLPLYEGRVPCSLGENKTKLLTIRFAPLLRILGFEVFFKGVRDKAGKKTPHEL